ncbi:MAG: sugar kinase [Opitutaceae bacterium]|nr:sugar kinase [Opitutaceae bacterium]
MEHSDSEKLDVISVGELIVEIMRTGLDQPLEKAAPFEGPFPSGAPAIMVSAAAQAGLRAGFVGAVGADEFGDCLLKRLHADGVDLSQVRRVPGMPTGCAFVAYRSDGSRNFIFHIGQTASGQVFDGPEVRAYAARFRHCHLMGCSLTISETVRQACLSVARTVKEGGGTVSFDPNLRPELLGVSEARRWLDPLLSLADVLLPSGEEARLLTGCPTDHDACRSLIRRGAQIVALKRGAAGCTVYTAEGQFNSPGFKIKAVDPTGAGDCFDAGFVTGFLGGQSLQETARLANAMGALGASRRGPMEGVFPRAQVDQFIATHRSDPI